MAIGDAIAQVTTAASTDRQPASGVEEKITRVAKAGTTDRFQLTDGSVTFNVSATTVTNAEIVDIFITNAAYFRKQGSADIGFITGVQTNV